jgi:uncharacterized protein (TIGR03437 family)
MHKLFHTLAVAALALALPLAALAQNNLNLDTGTTGSSGTGDITFNPGTSIAPVGNAKLADLTTLVGAEFSILAGEGSIFEGLLAQETFLTTPIPNSKLVTGEAIAVHTNGGSYAAVLVTAVSSTSITLQYVTYSTVPAKVAGGTATLGGPAAPSISLVQNNYSFILPGAPNYGIAPGALILIQGTGLTTPGSQAVLPTPPATLPTILNGSKVTVTVGSNPPVNGALYYACDGHVCNPTTQLDLLAVVLPSTTPVGTGTITVSYGGLTSTPLPITIVANAFGFDSYDGSLAAITDNGDGHLITASKSAYPGEVIVFWGSGDGADTSNTDVSPPTHYDNLSGITALYIGGVQVPIAYQGRSTYQGVDQIAIVLPTNAPTGCAVSVVAVSGTGSNELVSNFVTMPIATTDGPCTDSLTFVDPALAATLAGKTTAKFGFLSIGQDTNTSGIVTDEAGGFFENIDGYLVSGYQSNSQPSVGSCVVTQGLSLAALNASNPFGLNGIDVGPISVTNPSGTQQALTEQSTLFGFYSAQLPSGFVPAAGGNFTFNGSGGNGIGAFTAPLSFPNPLQWTNSSADGTIGRAQGVTVNWTGGTNGTYAQITGNSSSSTGFYASFTCDALVSAHTFTVPAPVLLSLPAGTGTLTVSNYTNPASFSATGLDFGFTIGFVSTNIDATYN